MPFQCSSYVGDLRSTLTGSFNQAEFFSSFSRNLVSTPKELRPDRQDLVKLAKPQVGVDVLLGKFAGPTKPIPGVVEKTAPQNQAK